MCCWDLFVRNVISSCKKIATQQRLYFSLGSLLSLTMTWNQIHHYQLLQLQLLLQNPCFCFITISLLLPVPTNCYFRADLSKSVYTRLFSVLSLSLVTSFTEISCMLMEASFIHRRSLLQFVAFAVVPVAAALALLLFSVIVLFSLDFLKLWDEDSLSDICKASRRKINFPPTSLIDTPKRRWCLQSKSNRPYIPRLKTE